MHKLAVLACLLLPIHAALAQDQGREVAGPRAVLDYRDRPPAENRHLEERLDTLLPALMEETNLDMWLVLNREYAEDPIYFSLVPPADVCGSSHDDACVSSRRRRGRSFDRQPLSARRIRMRQCGKAATSIRSGRRWANSSFPWTRHASASMRLVTGRLLMVLPMHLHQRLLEVLPETYADRPGVGGRACRPLGRDADAQ